MSTRRFAAVGHVALSTGLAIACAGQQPYPETPSAAAAYGAESAGSSALEGAEPVATSGPGSSGGDASGADFNHWPRLPAEEFALALRYANGNGIEKDEQEAADWAATAAVQDHAQALAWLEEQARGGNVFATLSLGIVLQTGGSALRNSQRADELFKTALSALLPAAERGDAASQYALSRMYERGYGVPKNAQKRREWLTKADGYLPAMAALAADLAEGEGGAKEPAQALELMQRAAAAGYPQAQLNLGVWYYHGNNGAAKDLAQALKWFSLAAAQGYARAQFNLGVMYSRGEGTERNMTAAAQSYERAVAQGNPDAQNNLALLLRDGDGIAVDLNRAVNLFREAAVAGDVNAQTNLAEMYRDGIGVPADLKEAEKWFSDAAKQGNERAKTGLGDLKRRTQCMKTARTLLFGAPLKCSTRAELRRLVAQAGGQATREENNYWVDLYDSSKLLDESTELQLGYTDRDQGFARATYIFQSHMDVALVDRVTQMVISKYGRPQRVEGSSDLGEVKREWRLQDGIVLEVSRGWPDTTTYLRYIFPENDATLEREQEQNRQRLEQEKLQRQSNAF
jgi:uncharacterized protein